MSKVYPYYGYSKGKKGAGEKGDPGPQGVAGPQGLPGEKGEQGIRGETGAQGEQGLKGDTGAQGPQGTQGIQGDAGAQGEIGPRGEQGPAGPQGIRGATGATGPAGLTWSGTWDAATTYSINDAVGHNGSLYFAISSNTNSEPSLASGDWAVLATEGPQGPQGPQGPAGSDGARGEQGVQGARGIQGAQGLQGPQGEKGEKGATGSTGATGPQGIQGATGLQGVAGVAGSQGIQGVKGEAGAKGDKGDKGDTGPSPYVWYAYTNIASGYAEMVIPNTPSTVFRVRLVNNAFEYSLLDKNGPSRYVDWNYETFNTAGAFITGNGTNTFLNGNSSVIGTTFAQAGLRGVRIIVYDWNARTITEITCYHRGRSGDSSKPLVVRMDGYKF